VSRLSRTFSYNDGASYLRIQFIALSVAADGRKASATLKSEKMRFAQAKEYVFVWILEMGKFEAENVRKSK
jgi:hypothetical protein